MDGKRILSQDAFEEYCKELGEFAEPPEDFSKEWLGRECGERARDAFAIWENMEWANRKYVHIAAYDKVAVLSRMGYFALLPKWFEFFTRFDIESYRPHMPLVKDKYDHPIDLNGPFMDMDKVLAMYFDDFKWFAASLWNVKNCAGFGAYRRELKRMVNVSLLYVGLEAKYLRGDFGDSLK